MHMDETTVQVLNEDGKKAQSKSYLWVQRGGPPDRSVILFDYDPGRGASVPMRLLEGYEGYLQTDGYAGVRPEVALMFVKHNKGGFDLTPCSTTGNLPTGASQ